MKASPRLRSANLMAFHSLLHQCRYATTLRMSRLMSPPCAQNKGLQPRDMEVANYCWYTTTFWMAMLMLTPCAEVSQLEWSVQHMQSGTQHSVLLDSVRDMLLEF